MADTEQHPLESVDPITVVFELNEMMLLRTRRLRFIIQWAMMASLFIILGTAFLIVLLALIHAEFSSIHIILWAVLILSLPTLFLSGRELRFMTDYELKASAVSRASNWHPDPVIPEGSNPANRLVSHLASSDKRVGYYLNKRRGCWQTNINLGDNKGRNLSFEGYFDCSTYPWDDAKESLAIYIRVRTVIQPDDIKSMKVDVEAAEQRFKKRLLKFYYHPRAVRAFIIQTENPEFSDELITVATEDLIHYKRITPTGYKDWVCPIELVAETRGGTYNFGTLYFG